MPSKGRALVIFGQTSPKFNVNFYSEVIAGEKLKSLVDGGNIYEATELLQELSRLKLPDGTPVPKAFSYKGFEMWWFRYNSLFFQSCLAFTQYQRLLEHLRNFEAVDLYEPVSLSLFTSYLEAYGVKVRKINSTFQFGLVLQGLLSIISLPLLMLLKQRLVIFTGDKFEKGTDHDFRMRYIYMELRKRGIPFVEFIRSLESGKTVLAHALFRKRPVVYSQAVFKLGEFVSFISGGRNFGQKKFGKENFSHLSSEERFKLTLATQYLATVYDDVWTARLMSLIFKMIGTRALYVTTVMERTFHAFLGAKLIGLPTVGILHGVASPYYNGYEFLPGFSGPRQLTVDKYGVWSEWWKELLLSKGHAYLPEQLSVAGLMRPLEKKEVQIETKRGEDGSAVKVLLVPGELSNPKEVLPYIESLLEADGISFFITFRPYRDGFENWLKANRPELLERIGKERILLGNIHDAIRECDVVVGSYSTAVIESLHQLKPPILFETAKWGDYFELENYQSDYHFYAKNPTELLNLVRESQAIPESEIKKLQKRFFGDPYKNGSEWVVEELAKHLS